MTELERRAMLGDRQAQEECTRKGILLPCPFCGGKASVSCDPDGAVDTMGRVWAYTVVCQKCCATSGLLFSQIMVIGKWNTRPAPTIGRCKDCSNWNKADNAGHERLGNFVCACSEWSDAENGYTRYTVPDDFCSYFEPKDGE